MPTDTITTGWLWVIVEAWSGVDPKEYEVERPKAVATNVSEVGASATNESGSRAESRPTNRNLGKEDGEYLFVHMYM